MFRSQSPENIRFNVNYHEVFIICKFKFITKVTFVNLYPQIKEFIVKPKIKCEFSDSKWRLFSLFRTFLNTASR